MATLDPYVVCANCGNRWPEHDQAVDWTTNRSKCCGRVMYREWDRPDRARQPGVPTVVLATIVAYTIAWIAVFLVAAYMAHIEIMELLARA